MSLTDLQRLIQRCSQLALAFIDVLADCLQVQAVPVTYIVMTCLHSYGLCSYGLYSHGLWLPSIYLPIVSRCRRYLCTGLCVDMCIGTCLDICIVRRDSRAVDVLIVSRCRHHLYILSGIQQWAITTSQLDAVMSKSVRDG